MWSPNQSITHKYLSVEKMTKRKTKRKNRMTKESFMLRNIDMLSSLVLFSRINFTTKLAYSM